MRLAASCSQALAGMLKELKGDRREQTGMREKERLGLEWSKIVAAIAKVWKAPWEKVSRQRGNGAVGLAYYVGQRQVYGRGGIPGCERRHRKIPKPAEDRTLIAT